MVLPLHTIFLAKVSRVLCPRQILIVRAYVLDIYRLLKSR
jgi:hypothetical protein